MPDAEAAELQVVDLTVRFGRVTALDGVTVAFHPGVLVGVMGPNGAGKTTLLNAMTGAVPVAGGEIRLGARRLNGLPPWTRQSLGIARTFQRCELVPELSVEENVLIGAHRRLRLVDELLGRSDDAWLGTDELLAHFGIGAELLDQPVGNLPYGWQRRVEIVRALVAEPSFLLLDEPVAGMDPEESSELGELIREWVDTTGRGAVLVEHDVDLVAQICDEVYALDFGVLVASGPPDAVLSHPKVVEAYLGVTPEVI
ncbi:MAG: ABC transporter ATP-binding protein [Actinomycetota bacterium]